MMKRAIKLSVLLFSLLAVISVSFVVGFAAEGVEDSAVSAESFDVKVVSEDSSFEAVSEDSTISVESLEVGGVGEDSSYEAVSENEVSLESGESADGAFISGESADESTSSSVVNKKPERPLRDSYPSSIIKNTPAKKSTVTVLDVTEKLFEGFKVSCKLFALTLLFALPLGLVMSFGSMSRFKPLAWLVRTFVWIIRGTPLMLQLFVVFYVPGWLFDVQLFTGENGRFNAALVAFVINYACYFSEIYRGGIQATPKGQYEAAQVLGMTPVETFFKVVLMQVVKRILAPMSNEVITLVKDTSLARVISVAEIFFVNNEEFLHYSIIWPLFFIAVYFLVFVGILTLFFGWWEKKLSYYKV